ncbi:MAG: hypothetical protein OXG91_02390 [bacterium]|nr:hypothetical protein [bacterium]
MDRAVPASFWRGGTSRAVLFREDDLSEFRPEQVEAIILAALGSPDPDGRQIDGLGGGISSLSKAAVVGPAPTGSAADVAFRFAQVEVAEPRVDFTGNCGNISAAVAPFAVNEGLVAGGGDVAEVVVLSLNTGQRYRARVPLRAGRYDPSGDFAIAGVPGTGARLRLDYLDPGGSIGRGALPTGRVREEVELPDLGGVPVSIVDVGNPAVFVAAGALGAPGAAAAPPAALDADEALQSQLEMIRCEAAVRTGVAGSVDDARRHRRTVPKVALVGESRAYRSTSGEEVAATDVDLLVRLISMGRTHRTLAMTGAMACAAAAAMDGSVVAELAGGSIEATAPEAGERARTARRVRLGHPAGVLAMEVTAEGAAGAWRVPSLVVDRTAREIMRGTVQVPQAYLDGEAWFASGSPP